jgi:hypothetical protein
MRPTTTLRIFDPATTAKPPREFPQEFYQARGLATLLSKVGRHAEAAAALRMASQLKRAKSEAA